MEQQLIFHILNMEPTKDEAAIKAAYLRLLKTVNPEDDPEGFKRLREAYENAVAFARRQEPEEENTEKTDIELWIGQVDHIYRDIRSRRSPAAWDEVLADPICDSLDTSLEVREALLAYLMQHTYLPHAIWKKLDQTFQISGDRELLLQQFPEDFLNYIIYYIQNPSFMNYELFEVLDEERMDADAYIRRYLELRRAIDAGETDDVSGQLKELGIFGLYHPYQIAEELRIIISKEEKASAAELADRLLASCQSDSYILLYCAEAKWIAGEHEEAERLWRQILAEIPNHFMAKSGIIRCLLARKDYKEAKELAIDLLDIDGQDTVILGYMNTANEALIREFKEHISDPSCEEKQRMEDTMELLWCLYQNECFDEAISLCREFTPDEEHRYSYENLFGRLLFSAGQYDQALPHLKYWLELIEASPDDGSEENTRRKARESWACDIIARCLYERKEYEKAAAYSDRAAAKASDSDEKAGCLLMKSHILFAAAQYELCIDVCDQLLQMNHQYYPAYIQRQEAAYKLHKSQQVVDDYYSAVAIYAEYYKPYMLAAEVFFYHDQFQNAKGVLDRAEENHVKFSPNMKLFQIKILRNLAENNEDRRELFRLAAALAEEVRDAETDIEDISEIEYETGLLHWDNGEYEEAVSHLQTAISQNQNRGQYHLILGHIFYDSKEYCRALNEYDLAEREYEIAPTLPYHRGLCYEALGEEEAARDYYEKTVALREDYDEALEKLANYYKKRYITYYSRKDFEKALEYFNRQLAVRENCYYLVERGRLYMSAFDFEPAIRDFKKALEYVKTDWASYNNIGCCYKYMGEFEKAIWHFEKAVEYLGEKKSVLPYSNMADCYEAMMDYKKAIECYEKDLEMFPDRDSLRVEIGQLYIYLGEYENARKYLNMVPDDEDYYSNIADIYVREGNYEEAVKTLETGLENAEEENKPNACFELASHYKNYEYDFPKAEYYLKKALTHAAKERTMYEIEWRLGELYFRMGRLEDAKYYGQRALEHFRQSGCGTDEDYLNYGEYRPARLLRHGWIYIALGDTRKGLDYFRQMIVCTRCRHCRHRKCFEGFLYLGWYYEAVGELEQALEYYREGLKIMPYGLSLKASIASVQKKLKQDQRV